MKLTKNDKNSIIRNIQNKEYWEPLEVFKAIESTLANKCYDFVVDAETQIKLLTIDEKWLSYCSCFRFVGNTGQRLDLISITGRPRPAGGYCSPIGNLSEELTCEVLSHKEKVKNLWENWEVIRNKVEAMLSGITTVKRLIEIWPEGEKYYNFLNGKEVSTLPAIKTDEINKLLNLERTK